MELPLLKDPKIQDTQWPVILIWFPYTSVTLQTSCELVLIYTGVCELRIRPCMYIALSTTEIQTLCDEIIPPPFSPGISEGRSCG